MHKALKIILAALLFIFACVQLVRPARVNPPVVVGHTLEENAQLTPEVSAVLKRSCMDCHSNRTRWPWYSNVAPVSWMLADHVRHGRRHLNFSDWARLSDAQADYMLGDICKWSKQGVMPLESYTLMHRSAVLSPQDVGTLCAWTQTERQRLAAARR